MSSSIITLTLFCTLTYALASPILESIKDRGSLRVGTTFDYKPFTSKEDGKEIGFDIELASLLAKKIGVNLTFVQTSWPNIVTDLQAAKYDIAMSGITHTTEREQLASFTSSYLAIGKCPLARKKDQKRFSTLKALNNPSVRIGVNPGGTNAKFVYSHCPKAQIVVIEDNLSIPKFIVANKVDVMITDNIEAVVSSRLHPTLCAINPDTPFTQSKLAYMVRKNDTEWLKWLEGQLIELQATEAYKTLYKKHLAF